MAEDDILDDGVSPDETEPAERRKPIVVDLSEAKRRLAESKTDEGRKRFAKPFPIPELDLELMIAGAQGLSIYEKLFGDADELFKGKLDAKAAEERVDRTLIKCFIAECVIEPKLDDEFLSDLCDTYPITFAALMAFCVAATTIDPVQRIESRLGQLDTEAQELFFDAMAGSTSMLKPA